MNDLTKVLFQSDCANAPAGGSLDTLAQLRKNPVSADQKEEIEGVKRLQKRARSKYAQTPLILALVDEAGKLGDFTMQDSYWNSFHCVSHLEQKGEKITGKYCGNRWCLVCSRVRTGKLINKYRPFFEQMQEPQFVTLTAPTVTEVELPNRLEEMQKQLKQVQEIMRKMSTPLVGVRKIEVQYNPDTNKYHPHFHLLIEGKYEAEVLVDLWLSKNTTAVREAQDIRSADADTLIEVFKYTTKLCSKDRRTMNAHGLHIIFRELRGLRTFQAIGGFGQNNTENDDNINPRQSEIYTHIPQAVKDWYWKDHDWQDVHGNPVSGYKPSVTIEEFRNNLEPCNANNVTGNSPQRMSSSDIAQTDADNGHSIPVKQPHKRPHKRPPQRAIQTEIQV
jgi:hypothetical protein